MVFSTFTSATEPRFVSWRTFRRHVESQLVDPGATGGPASPEVARGVAREVGPTSATSARSGLWRLLAPNNRELARSALLYASADAAAVHVAELQELRVELDIRIVHGIAHGEYIWVALFGRQPVMTAARSYEGAAAVRSAAAGALAALAAATGTGELAATTPHERRR